MTIERIIELEKIIDLERKRFNVLLYNKDMEIKSLKEEINTLHYTVKGACSEHLYLKISVSPEMMASISERDLTQLMTERANKQMAHAVEKQLGDRYNLIKEYDKALRHIFYLEHIVSTNCIQFTNYGIPSRFK